MASLVLKSMIPHLDLIPDLIAVSTSPRSIINQSGIFCLSTTKVICHKCPLSCPYPTPHRKRGNLPDKKPLPFSAPPPKRFWSKNHTFFSFVNSFVPQPHFYKNLPCCTTFWSTSSCYMGCFLFVNHLIKPIRSSNLLLRIFFFFNRLKSVTAVSSVWEKKTKEQHWKRTSFQRNSQISETLQQEVQVSLAIVYPS